ncbi:MAG: porin [Alcanivorax sp.]|nr:porin [Alcanivorax sp.]
MTTTRKVVMAAAVLLLAPLGRAEQTSATSLQSLEHRLDDLQQQLEQRHDWSDRISVNGFITYGMTRHNVHQNDVNGNPVTYLDRTTDQVSHNELSRAGLQFNATINDRTKAVVQLLARGRDDYSVKAQWAYLDYALTPSLHVRGGRMVLPFFMHSQYDNVGYAYHWAALPDQTYDVVPFDTMDGMDLTWNFSTGPIAQRLNVYGAAMNVPSYSLPVPVTYKVSQMGGINLTSTWQDLSTWLSYSQADVSLDLDAIDPSVTLDKAGTSISSVGVQYDNGSLVMMAERTQLDMDGWFPTKWGGYVSVGYRFGKWMPHVTWGEANSRGVNEAAQGGPYAQSFAAANMVRSKSWTFGVRHELAPGVDVKAEVQRYYDFNGDGIRTNGLFSNVLRLPGGINRDDPMVYRLTVDAAF